MDGNSREGRTGCPFFFQIFVSDTDYDRGGGCAFLRAFVCGGPESVARVTPPPCSFAGVCFFFFFNFAT